MTVNSIKNLLICALISTLCSMLVTACSKTRPAVTEQQTPGVSEIRDPDISLEKSAHENSKTMEITRGKPGARISLADSTIYRLPTAVVSDITLVLVTPYTEGQAKVTVSVSDGLSIVSEVTEFDFLLDADTEYAIPLQLLAQENGRYYIHLQVTLEAEGRRTFRALSAIVQVGPEEPAAKAIRNMHKAGEQAPVIYLPAEETILTE